MDILSIVEGIKEQVMNVEKRKNGVRQLTPEQAKRLFNHQVRQSLQMSGQEFTKRWQQGQFKDPDQPELIRLAMLIPLGQ